MRSDVGRGSAVGAKSTGSNNVIPNNPPNASSLERALPENESKPPVSDAKTKYPRVENNGTVNPDDLRFIAYSDGGRGQGVGNIMLGLLMAIDLGHEFNRTVCIEGWRPFHVAFQPHPDQERLCRPGLLEGETKEAHLWNMKPSMSVERMREIVASDVKIVEFTGNSGLGAPFYKPEIYREYFVPTKALQETLPWKEPPECVVQLRIGDGYWDVRRGLDEATLQMMEKELDKDCYLVTNHFDWYARFEKVGWGHPPWTSVWRHQGSSSDKLELWSDWYTVMRAKRVYHTQSGFSESAAQAGGCISRKITGINNETGTLVMEYDGPWRAEYEKRAGLTLKTERMGIWEMVRKAISMHDPNI